MSTPLSDETSVKATHGNGSQRAGSRSGLLASLFVFATIVVGNFSYIVKLRSNNPLLYHSGLGSPILGVNKAPFVRHGAYTIDGNDGWTAQALGRLAAQTWAHGHLPLWNLHEGLGQPLAGEMQSAAFFLPFVLFQLLPNGIFAMHLALELLAGLATLAFLRRLGVSWKAATAGGSLFALNGAFSVMTNAPFNPIAFLPMTLWGVELIRGSLERGRRPGAGAAVVALGLAWSLFSGFPETALVQGLFVAVWCMVRLVEGQVPRVRFALWCLLGSLVGAALAAPILVSLKHFLSFGYTAYHGGGGSAPWRYMPAHASGLAMPYLAGTFGKNPVSGGIAGYLTLTGLFMAVLGFCGPRSRAMRCGVGMMFLLFVTNMFGFRPAHDLLNLIPGMKGVLIYKYGLVVVEFSTVLFAAFGLDDLVRGRVKKRAVAMAVCVLGLYALYAIVYVYAHTNVREPIWTFVVAVLSVVALVLLAMTSWRARRGARAVGFGGGLAVIVLVMEAVASYAVPQAAASPPRAVDLAPVHYLQEHLGTSRFYSIGPIQPNYGSYWGLSQLNMDDLPVPQKTSDFVMKDLKPAAGTPAAHVTGWAFIPYELGPLNFTGKTARGVFAAYGQEQAAYREAGVKYLVTGHGVVDRASADRYGLKRVFSSRKAEIWEDAGAHPYYSTEGRCATRDETLSSVTVTCTSPTTLTRRQLASPGWKVSVAGVTKRVPAPNSALYQEVRVPAGTSKLVFTYTPAHFRPAMALSGLALIYVIAELVGALWCRRARHRLLVGESGGA